MANGMIATNVVLEARGGVPYGHTGGRTPAMRGEHPVARGPLSRRCSRSKTLTPKHPKTSIPHRYLKKTNKAAVRTQGTKNLKRPQEHRDLRP